MLIKRNHTFTSSENGSLPLDGRVDGIFVSEKSKIKIDNHSWQEFGMRALYGFHTNQWKQKITVMKT